MSEHAQTNQAHMLHFAAVAAREQVRLLGDGTPRGQLSALAVWAIEESNMVAALDSSLRQCATDTLRPLAVAESTFLSLRGHLQAKLELGQRISAAGLRCSNPKLALQGDLIVAAARNRLGSHREAAEAAKAALAAARTSADSTAEAEALHLLGVAENSLGEVERARQLFDESIALARRLQLPLIEALALRSAAQIAVFKKDFLLAREQLGAALLLLRRVHNLHVEAMTMSALATVEMLEENTAASRSLHLLCLARQSDLGDSYGQAVTHDMLGTISALAGDFAEACSHYLSALRLYSRIGLPHYAFALSVLGGACLVHLGTLQPGAVALLCHSRVRDAGYRFMGPEQGVVEGGLTKLEDLRTKGAVTAGQLEEWRRAGMALEPAELAAAVEASLRTTSP